MLRRHSVLRCVRYNRVASAVTLPLVSPRSACELWVLSCGTPNLRKVSFFSGSATLRATELDYDIDYISLTKTPKLAKQILDFRFEKIADIDVDKIRNVVTEISNDLDPGLAHFMQSYHGQLEVFLGFIAKSYDHKIKSFGQLTSVELLNCLYIFRDLYLKNKISEIDSSSYVSYNQMFDELLQLLKTHPDLPALLHDLLLIDKYGVGLLSRNFANYINELESLHKEFNLKNLASVEEISRSIQTILDDFNRFLVSNNNLNYNEEFFKLFIQINKYKQLKTILSEFEGISPSDLLDLVHSDIFMNISAKLHTPAPVHINLAKFLFDENLSQLTYVQIVFRLYNYHAEDPVLQHEVTSTFNHLVNLCCNGQVNYFDKCTGVVNITKFVVSDDPLLNYEFSVLFESGLGPFVSELKFVRSKLGKFFAVSTKEEIESVVNGLSFEHIPLQMAFNRLKRNLARFFEQVHWNPRSLDKLATHKNWSEWLQENQVARSKGKRLTMADYTGSSNIAFKTVVLGTELGEFLPELSQLSARNSNLDLSCFTVGEIFSIMKERHASLLSDAYAVNLQSLINDYNKLKDLNLDLIQKRDELGKDFSEASEEEILALGLPTDVESFLSFDNLLKLRKSKSKPVYVQLPDDLEMHKFTEELTNFKNTELKKPYAQCSAAEIESALNKRIDAVLNGDYSDGIYNKESIYRYVKLSKRLSNLFTLNGCYTHVLDTLIFSQSVFDNFEKRKKKTATSVVGADEPPVVKIYKQIPDHFNLEEYMVELMQLKQKLGGDFKDFKAQTILDSLKAMSLHEKKYNMNKRIIFSKLYRNLSLLFKHNDNETFVLDNVLLNEEVFQQFETSSKHSTNVDKFEQLVKTYADHLKFFLVWSKLDKADLVDFYELTHEEFKDKCNEFIAYIEKNDAYKRAAYADLVDSLKELNFQEFELPVLLRIHELKANNEEYVLDDVKQEVASFMENLAKNKDLFEDEKGQQQFKSSISVPVTPQKFDLNDFISEEKIIYNDPSNVQAKESEDSTLDDSELFIRNQIFHLRESEDQRYDPVDVEEIMQLTPDKIRATYRKRPETKAKQERPMSQNEGPINESTVQSFLEDANNQKKRKEENHFREVQAYEWTKNNSANRSLEVKNFFDPQTERLTSREYLLLSSNGDQVILQKNPLGKNFRNEEIFAVLNNFSKDDLRKIMRSVKKLQKRNWQLIGGGGDGEKMLVFVKSKKQASLFTKVKSMFAIAGATFAILIGLNWWLGDEAVAPPPDSTEALVEEVDETLDAPYEVNDVEQASATDEMERRAAKQAGWFWK